MSNCTLRLTLDTHQRIDMRWLSQAINAGMTSADALQLSIKIGNKTSQVSDVFTLTGELTATNIVLENSSSSCDYIGYQLPAGKAINVTGAAGHYAGAELAGGQLIIHSDAQHYVGCAMRSGMITVNGHCGNYLGGAFTGQKRGMAGGTILVKGNTGDFTGDMMRKGIIMVTGNIGNYCASRMIAGTITSLGSVGTHVGKNMRRGTLLFHKLPQDLPATFTNCGRHNLGYLTLLLDEMRKHDSEFKLLHPMRRRVQRYMGDTSVAGMGELLIWIG